MKSKKMYTIYVNVKDMVTVERVLNIYRIGLNDWDKSKVFDVYGTPVVSYTIFCDEDSYISIMRDIPAIRNC